MSHMDDDMPPTPRSLDEHDYESDEEAESDGNDDDLLAQFRDVLAGLRLRRRDGQRERRTMQHRVDALEAEIADLREDNTRLEEEGRGFRIQLEISTEQRRTAETEHGVAIERLTGQVATAEQRATQAENGIGAVRIELARARARIVGLQAAATDAARATAQAQAVHAAQPNLRQSLERTFNGYIAQALTSPPVYPQPTRYTMTSTTGAQGPNRNIHREFAPAEGRGRFVEMNGKVAWVQVWVQTQK